MPGAREGHYKHVPGWGQFWPSRWGQIRPSIPLVAISHAQRAANPQLRYAGVVYNGIDLDAHPFNPVKEDFLVFMGRISPEKRPEVAIEVARRAKRPLVMIVKRTEPAEQAYWDSVVVPCLGSDVEVLDQPTHDVKVDVVGRARAMLFPIDWPEPFGLVMTEAMACGTPVIARPLGSVPEVISHGKTGYLCSTVEQMVAAVAMTEALRPEDCRSQVEGRFSTEAMVNGYERVYEAATGELLEPLKGRRRHAARVRGLGDDTTHGSARQVVRPGSRTHRADNERGPRLPAP